MQREQYVSHEAFVLLTFRISKFHGQYRALFLHAQIRVLRTLQGEHCIFPAEAVGLQCGRFSVNPSGTPLLLRSLIDQWRYVSLTP
jgi:hypothetical protein